MTKYHVHVYKIVGLVEYDIEAESATEARQIAKDKGIEDVEWKESDTSAITVTFGDEEE
jgi:hypothetical protein